ncbi:MAG: hypothetical protein ACM3JQ_02630 [Candidatus Eiseniibacteriota bacterium]
MNTTPTIYPNMTAFALYLYTSFRRNSNDFEYPATHSKFYYISANSNSYKRKIMPRPTNALGFSCPQCGRNYGSIQFLGQKIRKVINRKKSGDDLDSVHIPKRKKLHPVEYSLRNKIIADIEEKLLERGINDLDSIRLSGRCLLPVLRAKKRVLEKNVAILERRVNARQQQRSINEISNPKWDVLESSLDIPPHIYELTKTLGGNYIVVKKIGNKNIVKWNPIKLIREYRNSIDPISHLDLNSDFYAIVLARYPSIKKKFTDMKDTMNKAFEVIDTYRKQFSDRNYQYTYIEWFWIVRYAQVTSARRAIKMLTALDGEEEKLSTKHVKDKMNSVLKFWEEFIQYSPHFFRLHPRYLCVCNEFSLF